MEESIFAATAGKEPSKSATSTTSSTTAQANQALSRHTRGTRFALTWAGAGGCAAQLAAHDGLKVKGWQQRLRRLALDAAGEARHGVSDCGARLAAKDAPVVLERVAARADHLALREARGRGRKGALRSSWHTSARQTKPAAAALRNEKRTFGARSSSNSASSVSSSAASPPAAAACARGQDA